MYYLNVIILIWILGLAAPSQAAESLPGPYRATVTEVIDGDTFRARIKIWLGQETETLIRLEGIDTPELRGECARERTLSRQARNRLQKLIEGQTITLYDIRYGKYAGRVIAKAKAPGQKADISTLMLSEGPARRYDGNARLSWC